MATTSSCLAKSGKKCSTGRQASSGPARRSCGGSIAESQLSFCGWKTNASASAAALAAKGEAIGTWTEEDEPSVLTAVSISALPSAGGPIAFSVNGKLLSLSATDKDITAVLGKPLRRE